MNQICCRSLTALRAPFTFDPTNGLDALTRDEPLARSDVTAPSVRNRTARARDPVRALSECACQTARMTLFARMALVVLFGAAGFARATMSGGEIETRA